MINLHLLTRISGNDSEFRAYFLNSLNKQAHQVTSQLELYFEDRNWASAYLLLEHYSQKIQPYSQPGYFSDLRKIIVSIPTIANINDRMSAIRMCIDKLQLLTLSHEIHEAEELSA